MVNYSAPTTGGVATSDFHAGNWSETAFGRQAGARRQTPILAIFFVISFVIPVFFYVGTVRLAPFLLILLAAFLPLVLLWATGRFGGIRTPDLLILFSCIWGTMALIKAHGLQAATQPAGILILQTFGAYLMGRCLVRSKKSSYAVFKIYLWILVILVPFAILETQNGNTYYLNLFSKIGQTYANVDMDPRMGLERVQGAFEHPILFGIFATSGFSVLFFCFRRTRRSFALMISAMLAILSVSTGAIVCLATQWILILWGHVFRASENRWRNLGIITAIAYVAVDILSDRTPFHVFVDYLTFNQGSAYNRILIWEFGTAEVWRHPFFGIGLHEWTRPDWMSPSMDNFWLVIAVRYGLPSLLTLTAGFLLILLRVGRVSGLDPETAQIRRGILISLIGVFVAICSVHLWNATFSWLMFLIGSTMWITEEGQSPKMQSRT